MQTEKKITITIILDYHFLSKIFSIFKNYEIPKKSTETFPQLFFLKELDIPISHLGIFLSEEDYNAYIKPSIQQENISVDFERFIKALLNMPGNKKRIFVRSSFLEKLSEKDAFLLKKLFIESGFDFEFKVVLESPVSLLVRDFFSLFYQISSNFRFSKLESFFQNIFKIKMEKIIQGSKLLLKVFGKNNVSFVYNEDAPLEQGLEKSLLSFYKEIGIEMIPPNLIRGERFEINPLFLEYIRCKQLEGKLDIHKEVSEIREIAKKFKLKNSFSYKEISIDSMEKLKFFSEKIDSFLPDDQKPLKNFMFIKTDACALKHIIPFIVKKEAK